MKKNTQIHLMIETPLVEKLKKEAEDRMISLSELCRLKLGGGTDRLLRMERLLEKLAEEDSGRKNKIYD